MARTEAEQRAWELQCYGCTEAELQASIESGFHFGDYSMVAVSMLSDAQEELARGMNERARQTINRAKFVIIRYLRKDVGGH